MKFKTQAEKLNKYRQLELRYYCLQYPEWIKQEVIYTKMIQQAEAQGKHIAMDQILDHASIQDRISDIENSLMQMTSDQLVRDAVRQIITRGDTIQSVYTKGDAYVCLNTLKKYVQQFYLHLDKQQREKISTCERFDEVMVLGKVEW